MGGAHQDQCRGARAATGTSAPNGAMLHRMDEYPWLLVVFALLAAAAYLVRWLGADQRIARTLRQARRTPVGSLRPGAARVKGLARKKDQVLTAPISGRPCLAYQIAVDEDQRLEAWQPLVRLTDAHPFLVDDGTGQVLVEPDRNLVLALDRDRTGQAPVFRIFSGDSEEIDRLVDFLRGRGIATEGWDGGRKRLRFSEGVLEDGEEVSVGGMVVDASRGLVLRGTSVVPILVSDRPDAHG
jgi:hypothetical protein